MQGVLRLLEGDQVDVRVRVKGSGTWSVTHFSSFSMLLLQGMAVDQ
jgi:hypothetical protein